MAKKVISVIERRLQSGSALDVGSATVPLKDPTLVVRWENSEIGPDHVYRCVHVLGWEYAVPEDLDCTLEEAGASERDQRIVRGERGKEVLLKMKLTDYKKVQKLKDKENRKRTFDGHLVKNEMIGAVAGAHGEEAAEFVSKSSMTVTDSRERVALNE